jgi:hypothetical protein
MTRLPPSAGLTVMWVPHVLLRLRAYLMGLSLH